MRVIIRILIIALILSIPITAIVTTANLITRAPDLYTYELTSSQVLNEEDLVVEEEELSDFISDFMLGKESKFTYLAETYYGEVELFNNYEATIMRQVKYTLDYLIIILGVALLTLVIAILILLRNDLNQRLRSAFKWGFVLYTALWLIFAGVVSVPATDSWKSIIFSVENFGEGSLLLKLFSGEFIRNWMLAELGISLIIMIIIGLIIWRITKPRRMFS